MFLAAPVSSLEPGAYFAPQQLAHFVVRQRLDKQNALGNARGTQAVADQCAQLRLVRAGMAGARDNRDAHRFTPFD